MSEDISRVLRGWDYEPGEVSARLIVAGDGRRVVQLRIDLGLMQMELVGRPDGTRPHGHESLLKHYMNLRDEYVADNNTDLGFTLDADACRELRDESLLYYYRYLSLFALRDWSGVERDTARNLACLDFLSKFAAADIDRRALEQYRPYILMMHSRSRSHKLIDMNRYDEAADEVESGLRSIKTFLEDNGREDIYEQLPEVEVLKRLAGEIESGRPKDPLETLREELAEAVRGERYERAAELRDRIRRMDAGTDSPT